MRPVPVDPDHAKEVPGSIKKVILPPDGDLLNPDVAPIDSLISGTMSRPVIHTLIMLEEGDMEALQANGGYFWLINLGAVAPFALESSVTCPEGP